MAIRRISAEFPTNSDESDEITGLFVENGIHMSEAEVADMFANALLMNLVNIYQTEMQ